MAINTVQTQQPKYITRKVITALKNILENITETKQGKQVPVFRKVSIGKIPTISAYSDPKTAVAEIYVGQEENFEYTFALHPISEDMMGIIEVYTTDDSEEANLRRYDLKDMVRNALEANPTLDENIATSKITNIENGMRVEGGFEEGISSKANVFPGAKVWFKMTPFLQQ